MYDVIRIFLSLYLLYASIFGVSNYVLLRWIVFIGVVFLVLYSIIFKENTTSTTTFFLISFIVIAILFNPLKPIYLYERGIWVLIDIISAIIIFVKPIVILAIDKPLENISIDRFKNFK